MSDIKGFRVNNNTYGIEDETARAGLPIANPTLAGTEESLNGLQIGNVKYKIEGEQGEAGEAGIVYSETEPTSESHPLWVHDGSNVQIPILDDSNIGSGLTYSNQKMNATFAKLDDVDLITDTLNVKKWNQIVKNGNFVGTSEWSQHGGSLTASNNVLTFVQSGSDIQIFQPKTLVNGHKYFCSFTGKSNSTTLGFTIDNVSESQRLALVCDNEWHTCEAIFEADNDYSVTNNPFFYGLGSVDSTVQIKNVFMVDLTDLYGAGNEPTAEEFRKLFPKEYYPYDAGTAVNGLINKIVELTNKADDIDLITDTLNVKKWNQIIKNGNFVDTSEWKVSGTLDVSSNTATVTNTNGIQTIGLWQENKPITQYHKYYVSFDYTADSRLPQNFRYTSDILDGVIHYLTRDEQWHKESYIYTADTMPSDALAPHFTAATTKIVNTWFSVKNVFTVDLTELYGAGNEPTAEQFKKMFPNDYYDYNVGTVINGVIPNLATKQNKIIETVVNQNWQGNGYNLIPYPYKSVSKTDNGITWAIKEDGGLEVSGTAVNTSYFDCTTPDFTAILPKGIYHISDNYNNDDLLCWLQFTNTSGVIYSNTTFTVDSDTSYKVACRVKSGATIPSGTILYPMLVKVNDDGTYPTEYQRYAMGNVELTNKLGDVETLLADL